MNEVEEPTGDAHLEEWRIMEMMARKPGPKPPADPGESSGSVGGVGEEGTGVAEGVGARGGAVMHGAWFPQVLGEG